MSSTQRHALAWLLLFLLLPCWIGMNSPADVTGIVVDDAGPVAHAHVRWQGELGFVSTSEQGRFRLSRASRPLRTERITASKEGYCIAAQSVEPTMRSPLSIPLARWPQGDHPDHVWINPHPDPAQPNHCARCHGEIYREWNASAHARAATNPKFLHLFAGSDGKSPVQSSWNVKVENPDGAGVCANCHVPTLRSPTLEYDVRTAQGVVKSGIHCDYCHKIVDAPTDHIGTRLGRDGLELRRPGCETLLFFGPLEDAVRPGETFGALPLYRDSRYCASCHEGIVFGVHVYGTYSEWLQSPARLQGQQCQDCHMTPSGRLTNLAPGQGGIARNPATLASHRMPGGSLEMLRQSLHLQARKREDAREHVEIEVELLASRVGHRVPTGFSDRQLILVLEATDERGRPVELLAGPRLHASTGHAAGTAGVLYAKQLFDDHGNMPIPFWLPVAKTVDTRLYPGQPHRSMFRFDGVARHVKVQLWYRRFWQEVARKRGWKDNDLLIVEKTLSWQDR